MTAPGPAADATPTALPARAEVVVIGAGIVGAAAARSLAEQGRDVLLLERYPRGHEHGSSHGATRIFRQGIEIHHLWSFFFCCCCFLKTIMY